MTTNTVKTRAGVEIFYKDSGHGTPLVFWHGMATTHADVIKADILAFIEGC